MCPFVVGDLLKIGVERIGESSVDEVFLREFGDALLIEFTL